MGGRDLMDCLCSPPPGNKTSTSTFSQGNSCYAACSVFRGRVRRGKYRERENAVLSHALFLSLLPTTQFQPGRRTTTFPPPPDKVMSWQVAAIYPVPHHVSKALWHSRERAVWPVKTCLGFGDVAWLGCYNSPILFCSLMPCLHRVWGALLKVDGEIGGHSVWCLIE